MRSSQASTPSAVAPATAEDRLRALIATSVPAQAQLIDAVRHWLRERLPSACEVVYEYADSVVISYSPDDRGYEGALAIRASADNVRLYFNRGKGMPDPAKLLRGAGKQTRWIDLEGTSTLTGAEIADLVDAAIARNPVPFSLTGGGSVVIRSVSAKRVRPG